LVAVRSKRRRARRRLRVAKRLLLIVLVGILVYGVFNLVSVAYRRVVYPPVRYQQAQAVDTAVFAGQALVLRDELALVAAQAGVLNILVDHGAKVQTGQSLFEIVDKSLLSSIDEQLALTSDESPGEVAPEAVIVERRQQLLHAQQSVRTLAGEVALGVRSSDAGVVAKAMRELTRARQNAQKKEQEYAFVTRSHTLQEERRSALLVQRQQAIHVVRASTPGYLSFVPDESIGALPISEYASVTIDMVRQQRSVVAARPNGERVPAGQAVGVVIDPSHAMLIFEAPETIALPQLVDVAIGDTVMLAQALPPLLTEVEGKVLVPLRLESPPLAPLLQRNVQLVVRPRGELVSSIPSSALVIGEETIVFVKADTGEHLERIVRVVLTKGNRTHVTGLNPLETVVVNPARLPPAVVAP